MTLTDEPVTTGTATPPDDVVPITSGALAADDAAHLVVGTVVGPDDADTEEILPPLGVQARPALAAALATAAAGLVIGGIFGSWAARGFGVFAAFLGAGWGLVTARSHRPTVMQAALPVVLLVVSALSLVPAAGGPGQLPDLVADAVAAGRAIRPPVPFDPGWRVLILCAVGALGFVAASVGVGLERPRLAVLIPLPVVGLASVTQPESEQFIAGAGALLAMLGAIGVLFGGDGNQTRDLDRQFELRRLVRGVVAGVPVLAVLVALNSTNALFPAPVYDPDDKPQKPRAAPLAAAEDRILFEVSGDSPFTGPWRIGALDVYEDDSWLIAGFDPSRLQDIGADGSISTIRTGDTQSQVTITVRDLGDSAVLPVLAGTTRVVSGTEIVLDPRSDTLRVPSGRVPAGTAYTLHVPRYPTAEQIEASPRSSAADDLQRDAPPVPAEVQALLDRSPTNSWRRLDFLRQELLNVVTASGAGAPVAVPPERVADLLTGSQTGTPFEIVAAEALLARWAGVPSRVAFGFDGLNVEDGVETVRPRNAAQWVEVYFDDFGWVPLIGAPRRAESTLDTDPNSRFDPTIEPSDDVAVEVYLPFEVEDLTRLYQRIRDAVVAFAPLVGLVATVWIGWPVAAKARRRAHRRRWAAARDPRRQIAVEYAEFRDAAIDLGVGDIYDTPLEYLSKVRDDKEHREFAWLAARALYGDMIDTVTEADVAAAEELSASLRRRLSQGQTLQVRLVAAVSRASLAQPYTDEVPNIFHLRIPGGRLVRRAVARVPRPAWLSRRRRSRRPGRARLIGDPR